MRSPAVADARWWWEAAACAGLWEMFGDPELEVEAKRVCRRCPVLAECRADGDATEDRQRRALSDMVLGGETAAERWQRRRRGRRRRRVA